MEVHTPSRAPWSAAVTRLKRHASKIGINTRADIFLMLADLRLDSSNTESNVKVYAAVLQRKL